MRSNDAKKYLSFEKDKLELEKILTDQNSDEELIKMADKELEDLKYMKRVKKN